MAELPPEGGEQNSEPLKYKTWVLKVSIHCEGCKRKVKRILHSVEGVYTIDVDTKQHKVIVTGNVEANTLIRKLEKSGKHAELFPNKNNPPQNEEPPSPQQNEEQQHNQTQNQPLNNDQQQNPQNPPKEVRFADNVSAAGGNQNPPLNNVSGGGAAKKKKKKKKKSNSSANSNNNNINNNSAVNDDNESSEEQQHAPQHSESQQQPGQPQQYMGPGPGQPGPGPMNMSPPRHMGTMGQGTRVYEYPPVYHAPMQPTMCGVSYNTAHPRSYKASYYSATTPYSYAYMHDGGDVEVSMPSGVSLQPPDTFELFSDENPNACSVM